MASGILITIIAIFISFSVIVTFSVAAVIDIRKMIIPNHLIVILFVLGVSAALLSFSIEPDFFLHGFSEYNKHECSALSLSFVNAFLRPSLSSRFCGLFLIPALFCIFNIVKHNSFGGGDIKLLSSGGFLTGFYGTFTAVSIGALLAGFYAVFSIITNRKKKSDCLPFAPFIVLGYLTYLF